MAGAAVHLRYLRYFVALGETRNLSRAAAQLHVAQPALSRQIRDLERELGVELLERHPKGVTPTPAGEALIHGAPRILANTAIALERAEAAAAGRRGRVVLGALRAFFALGLPSAVQEELRRDHPEIALVLQDLDQPELFEQLHAGVIDLGLGAAPAPHGAAIIVAPLWEETADQALVPAAHALARRVARRRPAVTTDDRRGHHSGRAHGSGGGPRLVVGDPGTRAGASRGHQHRSDRGVRVQGSHIRDVASERATACGSDCARQVARGGATPTRRTCGDSVAAAAAGGSRLDAAEQQEQGAADGRNPASESIACGRWRQEHRPGGGAARRRTTERVTATQRVGARRRRPTPRTLRPGSDPHAGRRLPGRGLSGAATVAGTGV